MIIIYSDCSITGVDKAQGCAASNFNPEDIENIKLDFTQFQKYDFNSWRRKKRFNNFLQSDQAKHSDHRQGFQGPTCRPRLWQLQERRQRHFQQVLYNLISKWTLLCHFRIRRHQIILCISNRPESVISGQFCKLRLFSPGDLKFSPGAQMRKVELPWNWVLAKRRKVGLLPFVQLMARGLP